MKNRTFAKLISLVLALLMVATVFVACNKEPENPEGSDATSAQNGENENKAPENAYTADTEGAVDLSAYTIIRPSDLDGDGTKAVATFVNYLKEYCGVEVASKKDNTVKNKDGKEIVIGLTDRQESKDVYAGLKTKDWSVSVKGNKIVVAAGSESSLVNATNWIVENALQKNNNYAKIGEGYSYKHEYAVSDIKVGDKVYTDIAVAYLTKDNVGFVDAGLLLADNLSMIAGVNTTVGNYASVNGFKIIVCGQFVANAMGIIPQGLTVGAGQYAIAQKGDDLMIIADDGIGAEAAAQKIIKAILGANKQAVDLKTLCTTGAVAYDYAADALDVTYGAEYRIMSYNIERVELAGNNRYDKMVNAVKFYNPDVVGFQEYCTEYVANANPKLVAAGYTMVNPTPEKMSTDETCADRYDINNNYTPIAYKTAKFDLVASGAKRIITSSSWTASQEEKDAGITQNENFPQGTYGWPGYTITWAVLKDKTTGDTFAVTSLHNKTGQTDFDIKVKTKNVKDVVMPLVDKIATDNNCPVFMVGDYNSRPSDGDLSELVKDTTYKNAKDIAVRSYSRGGSSGSKGLLTLRSGGESIDNIFVKGTATVVRHRYCLSQVTSEAADHRPVVIDVAV